MFDYLLTLYMKGLNTIVIKHTTILVDITHPSLTCSKLTMETLEKGVKYVKS